MESWNRIPKDGWMDGVLNCACWMKMRTFQSCVCSISLFVLSVALVFRNVKCVFWECRGGLGLAPGTCEERRSDRRHKKKNDCQAFASLRHSQCVCSGLGFGSFPVSPPLGTVTPF